MSASRIMGLYVVSEGETPPPELVGRTVFSTPEAVFFGDDFAAVVDTSNNRILVFDPYDQWPAESVRYSPQARSVFGQSGYGSRLPNRGQPEASANALSVPVAAAVAGDEVFLADSGNHRVVVLPIAGGALGDATRVIGQERMQFNNVNRTEGRELQFTLASAREFADGGIVVDWRSSPPHLYIADTYNNRVLGFRDSRTVRPGDRADLVIGQPDFFRTMCNYPVNDSDRPTDSSLCRPTGMTLDQEGNLYVADSANGRVLRFARPFANPQVLPRANLVLGQSSFTTKLTDPSPRTLGAPYGLAFAGNNGLLVSDAAHSRVVLFSGAPATLTNGMAATLAFGQPDLSSSASGSQDNRMASPRHIATDTDDRLYVADTGNNRVLIFNRVTSAGVNPRPAIVLVNTTNTQPLRAPRGVWVNPGTGEIWVADTNGNRVLRYPRFDDLPITGFLANSSVPAPAALAITQDAFGNLYVADSTNRVAIHFPGLASLNGANFVVGRALAPGSIASLFPLGIHFTDQTVSFNELPRPLPMPRTLADIQVLVNDQPAPLFFVSPTQINFQVPMSAPDSGNAEIQVMRVSTGQILAGGPVPMNVASPGLFTADNTGTGQILALNQNSTINSPENPAARGSVISLFATGQGFVPNAPADGSPAEGIRETPEKPRVIINTAFVNDEDILFSGLAPGFVGLWQINVRIPMTTLPGNDILVVLVHKSIPSNNDRNPTGSRTTIAVRE
jgi:uncharacterized protein (TIGR03437 family)